MFECKKTAADVIMGAFVYVTNGDGSPSESKSLRHTRNRYNYNTPVGLIAKMTDLERGMQEEKKFDS